jgi:hypothetical protein
MAEARQAKRVRRRTVPESETERLGSMENLHRVTGTKAGKGRWELRGNANRNTVNI